MYTETTLRQKLDATLGKENYMLEIDLDRKLLSCQIEVTRKYMSDSIKNLFEQMVPLDYLLEMTLRYNQYKKYKPYTYKQLKEKTYYQLRNEEVTFAENN